MSKENAQALLKQLQANHGGDFSNVGHSHTADALMAKSDSERMAIIKQSLINIANQFGDNEFVKSIMLGGACDQAGFMVASKNERIDTVVSEIRELRAMSSNTEIDLVQMDRKVNWMETLVNQRTEMELLLQACKDAFKHALGKEYVKRSKNDSAAAQKARRDANMTILTVDALLDAVDNKKLSLDSFKEEAAFAVHAEREGQRQRDAQAKRNVK